MRNFAIDLFCGAGGMTCGLIQAGWTVIAGVDNEERCRETYIQNNNSDGTAVQFLDLDLFPSGPSHPSGQQDMVIKKLRALLRQRGFSRRQGDRLILAICAPCQPFTKITKIRLSPERAFDQHRDQDLLYASLGLVAALKPDAILCENVEGIISRSSVLGDFSRRLDCLNYSFSVKVIDAEKFGVPQRRRRSIGIGYNRKIFSGVPEVIESDSASKRMTVRDAIGHLPPLAAGDAHPGVKNHRVRGLSDLNLKRISCAPPGESNRYLRDTKYGDLTLRCHAKVGFGAFGDTYTRMRGDEVSPTITTKFISITNGRFGHYDVGQNRAISLREGALLQSFPEDYVFHPEQNMEFSAALIGNAVPPRIAEFFGLHIFGILRYSLDSTHKRKLGKA